MVYFNKNESEIPTVLAIITYLSTFSLCRKLTSHFPVCGWLRSVTAFLK